MKIGIFGDSFADHRFIQNKNKDFGWPKVLQDYFVKVYCHAKSGTSQYNAFVKFLKYYHEYDVIIFSFTTSKRWPCLPKDLENISVYNSGYESVYKYLFELFPDDLLSFINSSIHQKVIELCQKNNKYLVSIIPFDLDFELHPNNYPVIKDLYKISQLEMISINGKVYNTIEVLSENKLRDHRPCHLNPANNIMIANCLINCIENRFLNKVFDIKTFTDVVINDLADFNVELNKIKGNFK